MDKFLSKVSFLKRDSPSNALMADICGYTYRVCHVRENAPHDFIFVYNTFCSDLHVTLPFDEFTMGILQILNVASTQLHPNSWATLQPFRIICDIFKILPMLQSFLFYYNSRPSTPMSWLSLSSPSRSIRFAPYTTSYKNFKEKYFKIFVELDGRPYFYDTDGRTKFHFHWTQTPTRIVSWLRPSLTTRDREIFVVLDHLLSYLLGSW